MENLLNKLDLQSTKILNDKRETLEPDVFKYITVSTTSILHVYIGVIFSEEVQKSEMFDWGPKYRDILRKTKNNTLRKAIKYLSMDLFAYAYERYPKERLDEDFGDFDEFKKLYLESLNYNNFERKAFEENSTKYKTGYNSKKILNTLNFPKSFDDEYLLNILDQVKDEHFFIMYQSSKKLFTETKKQG